jgi:tripartite tricarboxylate transporter TctB family protein
MSDAAAAPGRAEIGARPHAVGSALLSAAGFIGFVLIFLETGTFSAEAQPFPRLIAVVGMLGAAVAFAQSCRVVLAASRARRTASHGAEPSWRDVAVSYAGPPVYGAMLMLLGFWLASATFLIGLLWVLGERRPMVMALIAGGTLGAIYLVFEAGFGIRLPGGLLMQALAK